MQASRGEARELLQEGGVELRVAGRWCRSSSCCRWVVRLISAANPRHLFPLARQSADGRLVENTLEGGHGISTVRFNLWSGHASGVYVCVCVGGGGCLRACVHACACVCMCVHACVLKLSSLGLLLYMEYRGKTCVWVWVCRGGGGRARERITCRHPHCAFSVYDVISRVSYQVRSAERFVPHTGCACELMTQGVC